MSEIADVGEGESAGLLGHAGVVDDLEQQVAELVPERRHVARGDGVGDLVGLLDRVGGDRVEVLLEVPGTAAAGSRSRAMMSTSRAIPAGSGGVRSSGMAGP